MDIIAGHLGISIEIKGFLFALPYLPESGNRVGIWLGWALLAEFPPSLHTPLSHSFKTSLYLGGHHTHPIVTHRAWSHQL
jgi:hypothetical protein